MHKAEGQHEGQALDWVLDHLPAAFHDGQNHVPVLPRPALAVLSGEDDVSDLDVLPEDPRYLGA